MNRLSVLILLLGAFASLAVAASAPTFCKCTCFTNSTIIEIKPKSSTGGSSSSPPHQPPSEGTTDPDSLGMMAAASDDMEMEAAAAANGKRGLPNRRAQGSNSSPSCSQCNRSFCLSQSLPICKGAADKDVVTMCFQRDSRKDQVIVWGFILGTAGLLGWAAVQKAVDLRQTGGLGGIPGIGGGSGGGSGASAGPPRGRRVGGVLPISRGAGGSTGTDGGRGAYAAVAGHSRESSLQAT
ncbi:hypothetical protein N8I77_011487 [Diaporthe amygdali]|uniref:Uncharacterized protein n=1 Tax=Phomopsis amygdali TaxID=1214568 RepID=A0AAD9S6V6_PHOAM|nr:hypothetical protein N8I77_011487 [Diaporthe amygdali]